MDNPKTTRRLVQLYSALLHNAYLKGFIDGKIYQGRGKFACSPGFNCYSCPGAVAACPLGALQNALSSAGHRAGWYVLGILTLYGVMLGRTICGWLCPLGLIQELLNKIPTLKLKKGPVTRALTWLKYALLGVFVVAIPLWYGLRYDLPLPGFCKYICPAGTSEGAMGLLAHPANADMFSMLGTLFTRKFIVMAAIGLACVLCYRAFCRFLCPLGAIYGLFNRFCVVGVRVDAGRCNRCGACVRHCGMDVRWVGDRECIQCGRCMDVCAQGAISVKAGKVTLLAPEAGCAGDGPNAPAKRRRLRRALWGAALAALALALVWFNLLDPAAKDDAGPGAQPAPAAQAYGSDAPVGHEAGQQLGDFTLTCYDGSEFHLADARGKVVFINLWATYCTPCVHELPFFSDLCEAHPDDVAVIAVHASLVAGVAPEDYLSDKRFAMPFATDTADDTVKNLVGGAGALPQTVVLNRRGEVVYNKVGSVTAELLEELYRAADES